QRGLLVRPPRDARRRDPAPDQMPGRAGPSGVLGACDRARARLPRAVRLPAAARDRVPVLLLAVGPPRDASGRRRLGRARAAGPCLLAAPRAGPALRKGAPPAALGGRDRPPPPRNVRGGHAGVLRDRSAAGAAPPQRYPPEPPPSASPTASGSCTIPSRGGGSGS